MSSRAETNPWEIDAGFVRAFQIEFRPPAESSNIEAIERMLGCELPPPLASWYRAADGGQARAPGSRFELLSLERVQPYFEVRRLHASAFGYFPLAENDDSNPICVCCKGPLRGYVVQVPHDDDQRLLERTAVELFRNALPPSVNAQDFDSYYLRSVFEAPQRTGDDLRIASELRQAAGAMEVEVDRVNALRFACDLLAPDDVDGFRSLLDSGDEYVARHVLERLERLDSAAAKQMLRDASAERDEFVERCAALLRRDGIEAIVGTQDGSKTLTVQPGPVHLNVDFHFARSRTNPDQPQALLRQMRKRVGL